MTKSDQLQMTDIQLFDKVLTSDVLLQPGGYLRPEPKEVDVYTGRFSEVEEGIIGFLHDSAEVRPIPQYRREPEGLLYLRIFANYHIVLSRDLFELLSKGASCFLGALAILGGDFVTGSGITSISLAELVRLLYRNFRKLTPYEQDIWLAISACRKKRYRKNKEYFPSTRGILSQMGKKSNASEATKLRRNLKSMHRKGLVKQKNKDRWWLSW